jgi:hypothetical protein
MSKIYRWDTMDDEMVCPKCVIMEDCLLTEEQIKTICPPLHKKCEGHNHDCRCVLVETNKTKIDPNKPSVYGTEVCGRRQQLLQSQKICRGFTMKKIIKPNSKAVWWKFWIAIFRTCYIPQLAKWLNNKLSK